MVAMANSPDNKRASYVGMGVAIGAGVGAAIGTALDNVAVGLAVGVGVGLVFALGVGARSKGESPDE